MTDDYDRQPVGGGGTPGDGTGRREEVEPSGVYPASADVPKRDMPVRRPAEWGQGEAGAEGYHESGSSELTPPDRSGDDER